MNIVEPVISPCYGIVEEVLIDTTSRIYEWEQLFKIREEDGKVTTLSVGLSGEVYTLQVKVGDSVFPGKVLAVVKQDLVPAGSD
ncbi:hypothetical protein [Calidifontibacillus erzurumensis]|uniref:Biotin-dependent enzyme n=1 Tax=Calidifontibacillus erzurumensis TaxID=2741433 RepID=A0A8J8GHH8_9BACI|nr:hypothetical protein [Calidifontibacillus erzurumensis]NSL51898.1 hypothetical protein [Calidifontibacillus erzurumensis]